MDSIWTVLGTISPDDLGITLMHEHVCIRQPEFRGLDLNIADVWLRRLRDAGCRSLAEVTPIPPHLPYPSVDETGKPSIPLRDLGELSKKHDINIICSTGYYIPEAVPAIRGMDAEVIANNMVEKVEDGFGDVGVHPGIINVGAHHFPLTSSEEKAFVAAGIAQSQTGVAVCCHSIIGPQAQLDALIKGGAHPDHCYFSHVECEFGWEGRSLKEEAKYLEEIARRGGSLLFNNFGFEHDTPWEDLVFLIKHLIDAGCERKILISMDANWTIRPNGTAMLEAEDVNPECRRRDYTYLFTRTIPALVEAGIGERDIRTFLVENPKVVLNPNKNS